VSYHSVSNNLLAAIPPDQAAGALAESTGPAERWPIDDQALKALYQRLRATGKPPKLAFVALARKLLTILNAIARERVAWQP
jgi:transposase